MMIPIRSWQSGLGNVQAVYFPDTQAKLRYLRGKIDAASVLPEIHSTAAYIVAAVPSRDFLGEAAAILAWVQQNIRYIKERGEIFYSPLDVLQRRYGDCDDMVALFCSLCEAIQIATLMEVIGWPDAETGEYDDRHIYARVNVPPGSDQWPAAETTLPVPLGFEPAEYARVAIRRKTRISY